MPLTATELAQPDDPIIKAGRYQIWRPGATKPTPHTRVTNFVAALDNSYGLTAWKQRQTAIGIARSHSLRTELLTVLDNPAAIDDICERALTDAGANEKRDLGSQLHRLTELIDEGAHPDLDPDDPLTALANQYLGILRDYQIDIVDTEQVVVLNQYTVAGRYDRIVRYRGRPVVLDIKTGRIKPGSCARQLAIYANADTIYHPDTHTHTPMHTVDRDTALILHLPYDGPAELLEVDIAAGWNDVHLCAQVRDRGHRAHNELVRPAAHPDDTVVDTNGTRPLIITTHADELGPLDDDDPRPAIQRRIDAIRHNPHATAWLRRSWPANARTKPWPTGQLAAINELVARAETMAARPPEWFALQDRYKNLPTPARKLARRWANEAETAGQRIDSGSSPEHFAIASAMCALLENTHNPVTSRTILELASDTGITPDTTTGAAWLTLTPKELATTERIAAAITLGDLTIDGDDLDGNIAPLLAAP